MVGRQHKSPFPTTRGTMFLFSMTTVCCISLAYYLREFFHDDAYIALRYAEHLRNGAGWVWNVGERVEGYTSFLWVISCAGLSALGLDLVLASRILGSVSLLALMVALVRQEGRSGWIASLLLSTCGATVAWTLGGLETLGFTFLITLAMLRCAGLGEDSRLPTFVSTGLLFGIAQLCRPEAVLFFGVCAAILAFRAARTGSPPIGKLTGLGLSFLAVVGPHEMWRLVYYGDWLPNTFYVKGSFSVASAGFGIKYLGAFLVYQAPVILVLGSEWLRRRWRPAGGDGLILAAVAAYAAYVVCVGGDHMPWFRFFVPILPLLFVLVSRRLAMASPAPPAASATTAVLACLVIYNLVATIFLGEKGGLQDWRGKDPAADYGTSVGLYLRKNWPRDSVVALNTAGSTAFYSKLRCIDMLGLNDRQIARRAAVIDPSLPGTNLPGHRKGDGEYVLRRHPDFIIIGGAEGDISPWFRSDLEIMQSEEFRRSYALERRPVISPDGKTGFLFTYFRRVR